MTKDDILKGTLALSHSNQNYTVTVEGDQIIDYLSDNLGLHKLWIKN